MTRSSGCPEILRCVIGTAPRLAEERFDQWSVFERVAAAYSDLGV
jgi:hypothetical protein